MKRHICHIIIMCIICVIMTGCGQTTEETTKEYKEYYSELKATVESLKTENFIPYAAMLSMAENGDIQGRYKWYPFCEKTVSKLDTIIEKYKKKSIKNEELEKDHEDFIKELEVIRESYADFAHSCNYTIPPLTPGAVQKAKKKFELGIDGMSGTKLKISIQAGVWEEKLKDEKGGNVEKSKNDTGLDKNKDITSQTKDNTESTVKAKQENNFKVNNNDKLSLGGVSLNNTESEIKEILGTPSSVTSKDSGVSVLKYKDVEVHIANGQVQMIVSNSPNAKTSRGIHEQSSLFDAVKEYGGAYETSDYGNYHLVEYKVDDSNIGKCIIRFAAEKNNNDKVSYISIRRAG